MPAQNIFTSTKLLNSFNSFQAVVTNYKKKYFLFFYFFFKILSQEHFINFLADYKLFFRTNYLKTTLWIFRLYGLNLLWNYFSNKLNKDGDDNCLYNVLSCSNNNQRFFFFFSVLTSQACFFGNRGLISGLNNTVTLSTGALTSFNSELKKSFRNSSSGLFLLLKFVETLHTNFRTSAPTAINNLVILKGLSKRFFFYLSRGVLNHLLVNTNSFRNIYIYYPKFMFVAKTLKKYKAIKRSYRRFFFKSEQRQLVLK